MLLYTKVAPAKVPKKRSRAGCTSCKEKKKKCDEKKPCARCIERAIECVYEPVRPRQRRRRDSILSSTTAAGLKSGLSTAPVFQGRELSVIGYGDESSSEDERLREPRRASMPGAGLDLNMDDMDPIVTSPLDSAFDAGSLFAFHGATLTGGLSPAVAFSDDVALETVEDERAQDHIRALSIIRRPNAASRIPDLAMIAPYSLGSPLLDFSSPAFSEFTEQPNRRALVDHFCNVLSHLIVFREESGNPFQQLVLPLSQRSSPVMHAIYALASAHLEYRGVENEEKSVFFHNQAIQGLARLIEHDERATRNELLAAIMLLVYYEVLVQKGRSNIVEGHLKGALTIMSSHSDPSDPTGAFLERAFRFYDVIAALSNGTAPRSSAPGAGCLLPFPPLGAPAASPLSNVDTLLGMSTTLWPIIHRLSNMLELKTELEKAVQTNATPSKVAVLRTEFETTAQAMETALQQWKPTLPPNFVPDPNAFAQDDLVAVPATTDTPADDASSQQPRPEPSAINLDADSVKTETPSTAAQPEAAAAAQQRPDEEKRRLHSILHNALAHRHSALVYLYRTIHEKPRAHALVQTHAHAALTHCVATVCAAGPMGALLWPLFVAACEAVRPDDRELARRAFAAIERRQGMLNIGRAWSIVREVWRRADLFEGDEDEDEDDVDDEIVDHDGADDGRPSVVGGGGGGGSGGGVGADGDAPPGRGAFEDDTAVDGCIGVWASLPSASVDAMLRERQLRASRRDSMRLRGQACNVRGVKGADLWRRVSEDMGVNIVFG